MGLIHVHPASWEDADLQYRRALELFSELGDEVHSARSFVGLGNMAFEQSDLDAAQAHFTDARQNLSGEGEDGLLGVILGNLGVVATIRGRFLEAVLHYTEALKAYYRAKNRYGFCQTYHNLGMCHANQGDWKNAVTSYDKDEELALELGTIAVLANIRISRAVAELHLGDLDRAESSCLQAVTMMDQLNDRLGLAECHKVEGIIMRERGDYAEATKRLEMGLRAARAGGSPSPRTPSATQHARPQLRRRPRWTARHPPAPPHRPPDGARPCDPAAADGPGVAPHRAGPIAS
jgi:tetratricopeptide (TPR) repeat protein